MVRICVLLYSPPLSPQPGYAQTKAIHGRQILTDLKQKYQQLIDEIEQKYTTKELSSRKAHQQLSRALRMFVVEINGHRVDTLTLRDLEKTRYKTLAAAIKQFYIPEFTAVEQGSVTEAAALARKTVAAWN